MKEYDRGKNNKNVERRGDRSAPVPARPRGAGGPDAPKESGSRKRSEPRERRGLKSELKSEPQTEDSLNLFGRNAVLEAINSGKPIDKLLFKKGEIEGTLKVILAKAKDSGIVVQETTRQRLDELSQNGNHQGVVAVCPAHVYIEIRDILETARARGQEPFVLALDGITDPHNLGAIIRTAECCGVHGVIIPKRRAAGLTAVVDKTAAGALEYVGVARVTNLTRALEELKKAGLWIVCADTKGTRVFDAQLTGPLAVVIGAEGSGVSRLVRESCDFSVKIPVLGRIESLNASVAAGVILYEAVRRRQPLKT